jgi:hypothetical protein
MLVRIQFCSLLTSAVGSGSHGAGRRGGRKASNERVRSSAWHLCSISSTDSPMANPFPFSVLIAPIKYNVIQIVALAISRTSWCPRPSTIRQRGTLVAYPWLSKPNDYALE